MSGVRELDMRNASLVAVCFQNQAGPRQTVPGAQTSCNQEVKNLVFLLLIPVTVMSGGLKWEWERDVVQSRDRTVTR